MMPEGSVYGGWPKSGEIDIMEHINFEDKIHHTLHNALYTKDNGASAATRSVPYHVNDFNLYAIEWTPGEIRFYVNDSLEYTYQRALPADYRQWPYDQPFYIILNQSGAVGWPGKADDAHLPFTLEVDYVRVYQQKNQAVRS
jgi:beta-glucanase (GH16 family)